MPSGEVSSTNVGLYSAQLGISTVALRRGPTASPAMIAIYRAVISLNMLLTWLMRSSTRLRNLLARSGRRARSSPTCLNRVTDESVLPRRERSFAGARGHRESRSQPIPASDTARLAPSTGSGDTSWGPDRECAHTMPSGASGPTTRRGHLSRCISIDVFKGTWLRLVRQECDFKTNSGIFLFFSSGQFLRDWLRRSELRDFQGLRVETLELILKGAPMRFRPETEAGESCRLSTVRAVTAFVRRKVSRRPSLGNRGGAPVCVDFTRHGGQQFGQRPCPRPGKEPSQWDVLP